MWIDQVPRCAPTVAPYTMQQVVRVESGGNPLAVHVNDLGAGLQPHPATVGEAVATARHWIALGYRVDLGLVQIDSGNLPALHMTIEQVLGTSPDVICANLSGGAAILTADYSAAVARFGEGQSALQAALSAYNTGNFYRGFANGYVAQYLVAAPVIMTVPPRLSFPPPKVATVTVRPWAADTEVW
jgi:type IV secretion system protein VirB1